MRLKLTTSLDVSGVEVDHLALFGHWLAYSRATTDGPDPDVNQVVVVDLATSTTRTVARTRWPHGQTDWVEGTGNWIFWTDQQQEGSDAIVDIPWKIYGEDLATGTRVKIAQSEFASPPPCRSPRAGNGHLVWMDLSGAGKTDCVIKTFDVATCPFRGVPDLGP